MANVYEIKVKRAVPEDAEEIRRVTRNAFTLYAEASGLGENVAALKETLDDIRHDIEKKLVLVVKIDRKIVGTVRMHIFEDNNAYFSRFAVDEEHRNTGVGKILMTAIDKVMIENNVGKLFGKTCSKVSGLIRFYYSRGFYISEVDYSRGYPRATIVKEYRKNSD